MTLQALKNNRTLIKWQQKKEGSSKEKASKESKESKALIIARAVYKNLSRERFLLFCIRIKRNGTFRCRPTQKITQCTA